MKKKPPKQAFSDRVRMVVAAIPKGSTLTYQEVAQKAGSPRAYRAVGSVLRQNYDLKVPCHRVIKSDGSMGDYNRGGGVAKRRILESEGAL